MLQLESHWKTPQPAFIILLCTVHLSCFPLRLSHLLICFACCHAQAHWLGSLLLKCCAAVEMYKEQGAVVLRRTNKQGSRPEGSLPAAAGSSPSSSPMAAPQGQQDRAIGQSQLPAGPSSSAADPTFSSATSNGSTTPRTPMNGVTTSAHPASGKLKEQHQLPQVRQHTLHSGHSASLFIWLFLLGRAESKPMVRTLLAVLLCR